MKTSRPHIVADKIKQVEEFLAEISELKSTDFSLVSAAVTFLLRSPLSNTFFLRLLNIAEVDCKLKNRYLAYPMELEEQILNQNPSLADRSKLCEYMLRALQSFSNRHVPLQDVDSYQLCLTAVPLIECEEIVAKLLGEGIEQVVSLSDKTIQIIALTNGTNIVPLHDVLEYDYLWDMQTLFMLSKKEDGSSLPNHLKSELENYIYVVKRIVSNTAPDLETATNEEQYGFAGFNYKMGEMTEVVQGKDHYVFTPDGSCYASLHISPHASEFSAWWYQGMCSYTLFDAETNHFTKTKLRKICPWRPASRFPTLLDLGTILFRPEMFIGHILTSVADAKGAAIAFAYAEGKCREVDSISTDTIDEFFEKIKIIYT